MLYKQEGVTAPSLVLPVESSGEDVTGHIYAEGSKICTTYGLMQAFSAWYAVHFVFNMKYSKAHKKTLSFLERAFFNMKCSPKPVIAIEKILSTLNEILSADAV